MQAWTEFENGNGTVRGILHQPPPGIAPNGMGVVFLHGWSGCKLGPHRMFVKTARALSGAGCTCLRIDFRGRGDSDGESGDATIRTMTDDAVAAVAHLRMQPGVREIVLLGICSGGKVAVSAATRDDAIRHLALWSAEGLAPLRRSGSRQRKRMEILRQYAIKALRAETWKKLLSGRANVSLVRKAVMQQEQADDSEQRDEAKSLELFERYGGDVLFIYGGNDPETQSSAEGYRSFCARYRIPHDFHEIAEANHSFYSLAWEQQVIHHTTEWILPRAPTGGESGAP
jgi:pimeloyl-ACP methyl ester carboxylesterase